METSSEPISVSHTKNLQKPSRNGELVVAPSLNEGLEVVDPSLESALGP